MKMLLGLCAVLLTLGGVVPVCAAATTETRIYYVVYVPQTFNGTGAASQRFLTYAPYRGGFTVAPRPDHADYYQVVREMP